MRQAFWQMMAEEVEVLCGPRCRPDKTSEHRRPASESGSVYLGGEKEEIRRPRLRHQDDGVPLETYRATSSQTRLFERIVGLVGEGMSQRGVARSTKGTISKSAASRVWADKSREQLAMVRKRSLDQTKSSEAPGGLGAVAGGFGLHSRLFATPRDFRSVRIRQRDLFLINLSTLATMIEPTNASF